MKFVITYLCVACLAATCSFALSPTFSFNLPDLDSVLRLQSKRAPAPPPPKRIVDPAALIRKAAIKHRVPAPLVKSIIAAESNFTWDIVSPKGAIGLMQLMPETAREFGADPTDPSQNVDAGTHYLRSLLDRYHSRRNSLKHVIAAYNAGPRAVDRYHGIPPYPETRQYVARVLKFLRRFQQEARAEHLAQVRAAHYEAALIAPK